MENMFPTPIIVSFGPGKIKQANGEDIRVVLDDGVTLLKYDIEKVNQATGDIIVWANFPILQDGTLVQVYCGNTTVADAQNAILVYDSSMMGVYHMNNVPGGADSIIDSTINANHGTPVSGTISLQPAQIGDGHEYSSGSATLKSVGWNGGNLQRSFSFWVDTDYATSSFARMFNYGVGGPGQRLRICVDQVQGVVVDPSGSRFSTNAPLSPGLHQIAIRYPPGSTVLSDFIIMVDGVVVPAVITVGADIAINTVADGLISTHTKILDELQIFDTDRGEEYFKTQFNVQSDNAAFFETFPIETIANIPAWFDEVFDKRILFTVNTGQVPSLQNGFPLLIDDIFPELIGMTENQIAFVGLNNIKLPRKIDRFDTLTGELVAWTTDQSIQDGSKVFMYYDNPAGTEANSTDVWDSDYQLVLPLDGDANVLPGSTVVDSTVNGRDFTTEGTGTITPVTAKIGKGYDLQPTQKRFNLPAAASYSLNDYTFSIWANFFGGGSNCLMEQEFGFAVINQQGGDLQVFDGGVRVATGGTFDTTFKLVTLTRTGTTGAVYLDGVKIYDVVDAGTVPLSGDLLIGARQSTNLNHWNGVVDEVRVSGIARSADWIATEFNNQNDPNAFYTIGAEETFIRSVTLIEAFPVTNPPTILEVTV